MDNLGKEDGNELALLRKVIDFSIQQHWITENESLQITTESTINELERALFQCMKNVKSVVTASKLLCAIRCINEIDIPHKSAHDEHFFIHMIMSRLFEQSLVTEEEMIEFERKLEMDEEMNRGGPSSCTPKTEGSKLQLSKNPLEIPPVIRHVFQYLDTDDVIHLRLVSKEWSSAGLGLLFNRSKIKFDSPEDMSEFQQLFSQTSFEMIPFRKFDFLGIEGESWSVDELTEFFNKQGQYITELKFKEMHLVGNCSKEKLETWNITPWISNCLLVEETKTKFISKLSVGCEDDEGSTKISVDLSSLVHIKELTLKNVTINLQDGIRISPTKLKLSEVTFMKDEHQLYQLHLNDIVDFSKVTYASLKSFMFTGNVRLSLELNGDGKLDQLKLLNVELINFETCRWEVNKLTTRDVTFPENTQMQINELNIVESFRNSIDMAHFPMYIEHLSVNAIDRNTFLFNGQVVLHNIKFLHLNFETNVFSLFTENFKFPNLTHVYLENDFRINVDMELDLAWISNAIKVIHLVKMKIVNTGNEILSIDRLILGPAKPFKIDGFCASRVRTKELVLDFSDQQVNIQAIIGILEHQKVCGDCVQRFYVGPMCWDVNDYDSCRLRVYVDKEAEYYLLENQKGKAIEEEEFHLLKDLNEIYNEMKSVSGII